MKAQITEKIDSKTIQLAWKDNEEVSEVLYLETKNYPDGRRIYTLNLTPEPTYTFEPFAQSDDAKQFSFPKGFLYNVSIFNSKKWIS
jgi:hypothetical protein